MKRGITVLFSVSLLTAGVYLAISKWAIRHETLDLFDASRQRPVAVDLAVRRDYELKADDGLLEAAGRDHQQWQYRQEYRVFVPGQRPCGKRLSGRQHSAGYSDRSAVDDRPEAPYVGRLGVYQRARPTSCSCSGN